MVPWSPLTVRVFKLAISRGLCRNLPPPEHTPYRSGRTVEIVDCKTDPRYACKVSTRWTAEPLALRLDAVPSATAAARCFGTWNTWHTGELALLLALFTLAERAPAL